jgi:heme exporter protein D
MIEMLSDLYAVFITFIAFGLTVAAIVIWVMLSIDKKQGESFDEKYRRTRKHDGYKPGR